MGHKQWKAVGAGAEISTLTFRELKMRLELRAGSSRGVGITENSPSLHLCFCGSILPLLLSFCVSDSYCMMAGVLREIAG